MSRRDRPPIPVVLTLPAEAPTPAEVDAILHAADVLVGCGGRSGLALTLKGSASQKVRQAINETLGVLGPAIDATTISGTAANGASRSSKGN